jgi:hypothetical protein
MDPSPVFASALRTAKQLKADIVRDEGIGADLVPVLWLFGESEDDPPLGLLAIPFEDDEGNDDNAAVGLAVALSDARRVAFVCEGYLFSGSAPGEEPDKPSAVLFAEGDPRVRECITVLGVDRDDDSAAFLSSCPYRYNGRTVVWDDDATLVSRDLNTLGGASVVAVGAGFRAQRTRPTPALSVSEIANRLGLSGVRFTEWPTS